MPTLNLPVAGGKLAPYTTKPPREFPAARPPFNRIAYAAAHVVADPLADKEPWLDTAIDWERTIAFRRHLWSLGLGVAEAMDTAQRGMGMDWPTSLELIRRSLDAAKDFPAALIGSGAGTHHLEPRPQVAIARPLPRGVGSFTGDDFNYAELIEGDARGYSDALLGIFDAIAPAAAAALGALSRGDSRTFPDILAPTVPLSRHIFKAPTRFYKTGVVFMAYLTGLQDHFTLVGGQESARSTLHLAELFRLADAAGLLSDPDKAATRMRAVMATRGVTA